MNVTYTVLAIDPARNTAEVAYQTEDGQFQRTLNVKIPRGLQSEEQISAFLQKVIQPDLAEAFSAESNIDILRPLLGRQILFTAAPEPQPGTMPVTEL